jgi:hypothetical protein
MRVVHHEKSSGGNKGNIREYLKRSTKKTQGTKKYRKRALIIRNLSSGNHNLRENSCKPGKKRRLNSPKNHTCKRHNDA